MVTKVVTKGGVIKSCPVYTANKQLSNREVTATLRFIAACVA